MQIFAYVLAGMHLCLALVLTMGHAQNKKAKVWTVLGIGVALLVSASSYPQLSVILALTYVGVAAGRVFSGRWLSLGTGSSSSSNNDQIVKVLTKSAFATGIPVGIVGGILAIFMAFSILGWMLVAWVVAAGIDFCLRFDWGRN